MRGLAIGRKAGTVDRAAWCRLSWLSNFVVLVTQFETGGGMFLLVIALFTLLSSSQAVQTPMIQKNCK